MALSKKSTDDESPKYVAYHSGPNEQKFIRGTFTILFFLSVWISSMIAPLIFLGTIYFGYYQIAVFVVLTVVLAYMPWTRIEFLRPIFGVGFEKYFKESSLVFEGGVPATTSSPSVYCVHPHGVFCMGWSVLFGRPELNDVHFCFSTVLYNTPFFQLLTKLVGNPQPADKKTFQTLMKEKKSLALIPGGFEEATIHSENQNRIFLKNRCGFVKYALENGYALTPIYCFGENQTYSNVQGLWKFRLWLNSLGFPAVVPFGSWWLPLLPRNKKMHIVVGKSIQLPCIEKPTKEQVSEHHSNYIEAVKKLFEDNKKNYGEEKSVLEVW